MIGANAVVLTDIPKNATVVGVPGKVVRIDGKPISHAQELDQSITADPMEQELCKLLHRVIALEKNAGIERAGINILKSCEPKDTPEDKKNETHA
jgi:serine O-acetyltransferase